MRLPPSSTASWRLGALLRPSCSGVSGEAGWPLAGS
ncbi:Uncharacterised protein [Bordetella pertussis]|nr:Uncharacterised protein [Bordetella pertussis]